MRTIIFLWIIGFHAVRPRRKVVGAAATAGEAYDIILLLVLKASP